MATGDVCVIVVNYNSGPYLTRCLEALRVQTLADFRVTVVDNGSTDGSCAQARAAVSDPRFQFVLVGRNLGFAAANNIAARDVECEWLATLNPDAFPAPAWLARLIDATRRYPDTDMFASTQLSATDTARLDGVGDVYSFLGLFWRGGHGHPATAAPAASGGVFSPCAAAALYRTAVFREVGGFDERFFCYGEDLDLGFRFRLRGSRAIHVPDAVVHHIDGASTQGGRSDFALYHSMRNRIWLFAKNMPGPLLWLLGPGHVACNLWFLAKALPAPHRVPVWRGLRDAVAGLPATLAMRRRVQATRRMPAWSVASWLCWSPRHLWARAPHRIRH